jgi:hypothetical protein
MRRVVAIAAIVEFCIVALLLYSDVKDFICTLFLAKLGSISQVVPILERDTYQ